MEGQKGTMGTGPGEAASRPAKQALRDADTSDNKAAEPTLGSISIWKKGGRKTSHREQTEEGRGEAGILQSGNSGKESKGGKKVLDRGRKDAKSKKRPTTAQQVRDEDADKGAELPTSTSIKKTEYMENLGPVQRTGNWKITTKGRQRSTGEER